MAWRTYWHIFLTVFVTTVLLCTSVHAKTIYVDDDGAADFATIQAAINDANDGDVVIVQPGTYTGDGNRDIDFKGKAITVRSIDPNDPNIVAETTIDCNGNVNDPHRGFIFHSSEGIDTCLLGVTITNGYAEEGAGIYCNGSGPTIDGCAIISNSAAVFGGGIACRNSSLTISDCTIRENSSDYYGGGIHLRDSDSFAIVRCTIEDNSSGSSGGGVSSWDCNTVTITNCIIRRNKSAHGGGIWSYTEADHPGSKLEVNKCTINENAATSSGGGMYTYDCTVHINDCDIIGNSSNELGGGLCKSGGDLMLTDCVIRENTVDAVG